ncbi:alanine racemase [Gluconacetobacter diazotrophicus PA1 5]|uniref:Alanine racemase n=2 Tax=Gluconacetobacter diazotrophicus TaxID=33996 RepID=A9HMX6_GLUDA|nr:alanine racemase [Gluconacetobacter diazotrophicus]ACI50463.1 alanine racemase [Gluconacetobacter diazotrophicus PA1 5]MBB2158442.1 alanine racemase [Gluconacetobacter diazotrophicus]TWA98307.1 alanine racemase [Gluconacetobacter diazotrophicus]CAP56364.1 putative alanine racemase, catabolic [Gluconacetobacter diazotrophicus PA1 5]
MPVPPIADTAWPHARAGATLTIDLDAIRANYRTVRNLAAGAECAAVVKADAYGLGAARVAPALQEEGARTFFVAHLDEGMALRRHVSADARIIVLHGAVPGAEKDCLHDDLIPVLNSVDQIQRWRGLAHEAGRALPSILQLDTGMSRFGLSENEIRAIVADPDGLRGIDLRLVISHLACADDPDDPASTRQRARLVRMRALLPPAPVSLAASSGVFLGRDFHFDLVRPGAALYGVAPNAATPNPMRPVVRLQARILQTRHVSPNDGVGYGLTYRPSAMRRIATIATGYADGFMRSGAARGCAWLGDMQLPVLGRISMDSMTVDVTDAPETLTRPGTMVDLLGPRRGVDDVARAAGTIGYEILTSLGHRYHRAYVAGGSDAFSS